MTRLFPLNRSITGEGVRETLRIIQEHIPIEMHEVPTGTDFGGGWVVPQEWRLNRATLTAPNGKVVVDTSDSNLHVVGYSIPFKGSEKQSPGIRKEK